MEKENLVKYIETAWLLESECYELGEKIQIKENFLNELNAKETANNKQIYNVRQSYEKKPQMPERYDLLKNSINFRTKTQREMSIFIVVICILIMVGFIYMDISQGIIGMLFIGIPLAIPCFKEHKKCKDIISSLSEELSKVQADYSRDMDRYNKELSTFDQRKSCAILRIEEENRKIVYMTEETRKLNEQLNAILNEKKKNLNLYYEGIIHRNYQNLGSISYFYDYLDTGRCETLKECMNKLDDDVFHEKVNMNLHNIFMAINKNTEAVNRVDRSLQNIKSTIIDAASDISGILSDMDLNNFEYHNKRLREQAETKKYVKNMNDIQHYRALVSGEILPTRW